MTRRWAWAVAVGALALALAACVPVRCPNNVTELLLSPAWATYRGCR